MKKSFPLDEALTVQYCGNNKSRYTSIWDGVMWQNGYSKDVDLWDHVKTETAAISAPQTVKIKRQSNVLEK